MTPEIIGTWRERAYLNWRFVRHPLHQYGRIGWEVDGRIRGFIVTSSRDLYGLTGTLVVELAAVEDSAEIEHALLAEAEAQARRTGASFLAVLAVPGSHQYRRLVIFDFISSHRASNRSHSCSQLIGLVRRLRD